MSLDTTPLSAVLDDTATTYETVAALTPTEHVPTARARAIAQSAPPPGVLDVLDDDELHRAIAAVDDWALFLAHVLLDELDGLGAIPPSTPGQLRLAARWADHLDHHPDAHLRYAIGLDAREHLATMRRLSKRGTRVIRTTSPCMDVACPGEYVATIAGADVTDELVCNRCGQRVPPEQWQRWGSRSVWVTPEHASRLLGCTVQAVWQRASRERWRRTGRGRDTRYHREDVTGRAWSATVSGMAL